MSNNAAVNTFVESDEPTSWIERISENFLKNRINRNLKKATKVHPCIINNHRVLVHEYGLKGNSPEAFEQLKAYAQTNNSGIKKISA